MPDRKTPWAFEGPLDRGGLGDAVLEAFTGVGTKPPTVLKLGVRKMPGSATPAQLMSAAGIDAEHIVQAVRALL